MFRRSLFALVALATLLPIVASSQAVIPAHINLHNGYIVVRNEVELKGGAVGGYDPITLRNGSGQAVEVAQARAGETTYLNHCCILAGTLYDVSINIRGEVNAKVRPILCNVRGIPFGYEVVVFTGDVTFVGKGAFTVHVVPHVLTPPCPVDPPR